MIEPCVLENCVLKKDVACCVEVTARNLNAIQWLTQTPVNINLDENGKIKALSFKFRGKEYTTQDGDYILRRCKDKDSLDNKQDTIELCSAEQFWNEYRTVDND